MAYEQGWEFVEIFVKLREILLNTWMSITLSLFKEHIIIAKFVKLAYYYSAVKV